MSATVLAASSKRESILTLAVGQLPHIRYAESMAIRNSAPPSAAVSRIGQRRQVVIPKAVFEALQLQEGDFVEVTVERGRLAMQPKQLVDVSELLTKGEAAKVRQGEAQLKAGKSKPWHPKLK